MKEIKEELPYGSFIYEENGIKVVSLPTIGQPASILTAKQGRQGNLYLAYRDRLITTLMKKKGVTYPKSRRRSFEELIITCNSILNHKNASIAQKEIVLKAKNFFLSHLEMTLDAFFSDDDQKFVLLKKEYLRYKYILKDIKYVLMKKSHRKF